jgi:hypothetical protein
MACSQPGESPNLKGRRLDAGAGGHNNAVAANQECPVELGKLF